MINDHNDKCCFDNNDEYDINLWGVCLIDADTKGFRSIFSLFPYKISHGLDLNLFS